MSNLAGTNPARKLTAPQEDRNVDGLPTRKTDPRTTATLNHTQGGLTSVGQGKLTGPPEAAIATGVRLVRGGLLSASTREHPTVTRSTRQPSAGGKPVDPPDSSRPRPRGRPWAISSGRAEESPGNACFPGGAALINRSRPDSKRGSSASAASGSTT